MAGPRPESRSGGRRLMLALLAAVTLLVVTGLILGGPTVMSGQPTAAPRPTPTLPAVDPSELENLPELVPPFQRVVGIAGDGKVAHLTFDDGPGPETNRVLDALDAAGVRATFCQVGSRIDDYPDTERRIIAGGHTLCNHSWTHPENLHRAPAATINDEIQQTQRKMLDYGVRAHYFRAPGGGFGQTIPTLRQVCQLNDVVPLGWVVDSQDWEEPGVGKIVDQVLSTVQPGAVILLHDAGGATRDQTIAAIPGIVDGLRAAGYSLEPLPAGGIG